MSRISPAAGVETQNKNTAKDRGLLELLVLELLEHGQHLGVVEVDAARLGLCGINQ